MYISCAKHIAHLGINQPKSSIKYLFLTFPRNGFCFPPVRYEPPLFPPSSLESLSGLMTLLLAVPRVILEVAPESVPVLRPSTPRVLFHTGKALPPRRLKNLPAGRQSRDRVEKKPALNVLLCQKSVKSLFYSTATC